MASFLEVHGWSWRKTNESREPALSANYRKFPAIITTI